VPLILRDKTITVFAAASLKNALDDVDAAFTKQTGAKVVTSYDASSALMKQIEGAPADVFVSADLKWMDYGVESVSMGNEHRGLYFAIRSPTYDSQPLANRGFVCMVAELFGL
jgi:molybdate transport system substrate-binding protein